MTSAFRRQPLSGLRADTWLRGLPLVIAHPLRQRAAGEPAEGGSDDGVVLDRPEWNGGGLRAEAKVGDHVSKPRDERVG